MKPHHKLLTVYQKWPALEEKYCTQTKKIIFKEPILSFQRNVFFPRKDEEKIKYVNSSFYQNKIFKLKNLYIQGTKKLSNYYMLKRNIIFYKADIQLKLIIV